MVWVYAATGIQGTSHSWIWSMCVDNVHIVEAQGNHFDVMLPNEEGGDLTHTIAPLMSKEVHKWCVG
eukprot:4727440-Pyramimonas_sp.AAC.6